MKTIKLLISLSVLIILNGCSSNDEPGKSFSKFEAEFLELTPGGSIWNDELYALDFAIFEVLNANGMPVDISSCEEERSDVTSLSLKTKYTLSLYTNSADLTINTTGVEYVETFDVKTTSYKFTQGKYIIPAEVLGTQLPMCFIVESDCIYYCFEIEPGSYTNKSYFLDLINFEKTISAKISEERESTRPIEPTEYKGKFNAITDPNGVVALKNSEFTFNFIPATGLLTQIEPEYKEIGELDRIN